MDGYIPPEPSLKIPEIAKKLKEIADSPMGSGPESLARKYDKVFAEIGTHIALNQHRLPAILVQVASFLRYAAETYPNRAGHRRAYDFIAEHAAQSGIIDAETIGCVLARACKYPLNGRYESLVSVWSGLVRSQLLKGDLKLGHQLIDHALALSRDEKESFLRNEAIRLLKKHFPEETMANAAASANSTADPTNQPAEPSLRFWLKRGARATGIIRTLRSP